MGRLVDFKLDVSCRFKIGFYVHIVFYINKVEAWKWIRISKTTKKIEFEPTKNEYIHNNTMSLYLLQRIGQNFYTRYNPKREDKRKCWSYLKNVACWRSTIIRDNVYTSFPKQENHYYVKPKKFIKN